MKETRESFVFYRGFYEAIKELDNENKLIMYDAICEYGLYGNCVELSGVNKMLFRLIYPNIEANYQRFINGQKGGRPPKKEKKPEVNKNKTIGYGSEKPNEDVDSNEKKNVYENNHSNKDLNESDYLNNILDSMRGNYD